MSAIWTGTSGMIGSTERADRYWGFVELVSVLFPSMSRSEIHRLAQWFTVETIVDGGEGIAATALPPPLPRAARKASAS